MKLKDLRRGMRCTNREGDTYIIDYIQCNWEDGTWLINFIGNSKNGYCAVGGMEEGLRNGYVEKDIMKIEDIGIDGYKTIWEREEEKYYLRLPNYWSLTRNYLNYNIDDKTYCFGSIDEGPGWQTVFTQEEIDKLPDQKFIKCLIKEEVK